MNRGALISCFLFFTSYFCFGQNNKINALNAVERTADSIMRALPNAQSDTQKAGLYNTLSSVLQKLQRYDESYSYSQKAFSLAEKAGDQRGMAISLSLRGVCEDMRGNFDSAIACYNRALPVLRALGEKTRVGNVYLALGNAYDYKGNRLQALEHYILSLKIRESLGDSINVAGSLLGIGNCYSSLGIHEKAIENYTRSYGIYQRNRRRDMMSWLLNNIGVVYFSWGKNDLAMDYFIRSVKMKKEAGENDYALSTTYIDMTDVFLQKGNYKEAKKYARMALDIRKQAGDPHSLASAYNKTGLVYQYAKQFGLATDMYNEAIKKGLATHSYDVLETAYHGMATALFESGNAREAYEYRMLFESAKDSLLNLASSRQLNELSTKYETDQKVQQIKFLNKDKEFQAMQLNRQKIIIYAGSAGLILILSLTLVVLRSLRLNKKKNRIISRQKAIVEHQKEIVEEKQKEILDSIHYAKRIQQALLPGEKYIERNLNRRKNG